MTSKTQTWWSAALDRQRSLAIVAPLQELEVFKSHVGAQEHDVRTYCLYVIDQVVLGMRAHRGERLDVVERALGELISRCEPQLNDEVKGRIVAYVIDGLLNARRRGPFIETLTDFDESGEPRRVRYRFTLLEAKDLGDEAFYLVASPQAIRLYTDLLARDVTDEQIANEYLFHFLVERGEWQKAAEESARMELLSLEYQETIRKAIDQTEVNVRAVNWKDTMLPVLQRARQHVGERVRAENSVLASLRDKLSLEETLSDDDRWKLVKVEDTLNTVICRHTRLAQTLLEANQRFAEAQDAQCYRPRLLTRFADLETDLFRPLLLSPLGRLAAKVEEFAEFVFRPEPRPVVSLVEMVDRLLQAEKQHHAPASDADSNLEAVEPQPPFLSIEQEAQAKAMLESIAGPCLLTEVLEEMASQGLALKVQDLVVTHLLRSIGQADSSLRVLANGGKLVSDGYAGDELAIEPLRTTSPRSTTETVANL
ncbi:MAG: hypothetical protein L0Z50_14205 [Verrucomicrobiales bacterium]|nr:hypothetical protein [Verrucomicrobiales bacterium]